MITNRQDLAEFALRQLGGGVVNVEISDDQIDDAVELAIQYYQEYHFDGIERDYIKHKVTATTMVVANASNFVIGDYITGQTSGCIAQIIDIDSNTIAISKMKGENQFVAAEVIKNSRLDETTITSISKGTMDLGYVVVDDSVVGVKKVINLTNILTSSDYMFNAQYQMMLSEIQNIAAAQTQYLYGVLNYMGHLDFILRKEKSFRFNRRQNKIFLDIQWDADVRVSDYLVIEVYKALDDATYGEILNDMWLKKYTTALFKRQWGQNLSKYDNMQLPGGLTYNGKYMLEQANSEITQLEKEAAENSAPLFFEVG